MPCLLSEPFKEEWKNKDPFKEAFSIKGKVYREIESRRTLRFEMSGVGYFIKLHYELGWWPIIREWARFRPPNIGAKNEYDALSLLEKIGVNSLRAVGFGSFGRNPAKNKSFLITQELTNTTSLDVYCKNWVHTPPIRGLKRALIINVADIIRKIHSAGTNHRDCYLVHFLLHNDSVPVESEANNIGFKNIKISLIDLHRAQVREKVPRRWIKKDLAAIYYSSTDIGLTFKDQCRFLKTYFHRPLREVFDKEKALLNFLKSEAERLKNRWERNFSETAIRKRSEELGTWINPKYYDLICSTGRSVNNLFDYFWELKLEGVDRPNIGRGGMSEVFRIRVGKINFYLKRQTMHLRYSLQSPFGEPTFSNEFRYLQRLRGIGLNVPEVVFYGPKNLPSAPKSAVIVTRSLNDRFSCFSEELAKWRTYSSEKRLRIMEEVGASIRLLHSNHVIHNSLYPKHIFLASNSLGSIEVALIDFEKARYSWFSWKKKSDLYRLYRHLPKTDEIGQGVTPVEWEALLAGYQKDLEPRAFTLSNGRLLAISQVHRYLPGRRITAKAFLDNEQTPVLAKIFLGTRAQQRVNAELDGLALLSNAGVPCPKVLQHYFLSTNGQVITTEYFEGASTLADRLGKALNLNAKTDVNPSNDEVLGILLRAIRAVGRMHQAGLIHEDLHFANILFVGDITYLLDGDKVRKVKYNGEIQQNLAVFFAQLQPAQDRFQSCLLSAYERSYPSARFINEGSMIEELEGETRKQRLRRLKDFLSKALRDCTLFRVSKSFRRFIACSRGEEIFVAPLLKDPNSFMGDNIIKSGKTCTVSRAVVGGKRVVIKRYNIKGFRHLVGRFWRSTRAERSWLAANRLRFWGIPTPTPIALIEERLGPLRGRSWYVMEDLRGERMDVHYGDFQSNTAFQQESESLQTLFTQLRDQNISHGDMKASNFIWAGNKWWLIDLDSVRAHQHREGFEKAWRRDQLRFRANWTAEQWALVMPDKWREEGK